MITENPMELIVLVENTTFISSLCARHGLALLLHHKGGWVLFDTGSDQTIVENMQSLSLPLHEVSHVVISHGHYDHAGGLESVFSHASLQGIYAHPDALIPKYRQDGSFIGMRLSPGMQKLFTPITTVTEILPSVWVIPDIRVVHADDLHTDGLFVQKDTTREIDNFEDEVCVVLEHADSLTVYTGCAHRGITNTIETVLARFSKPIDLVIGGFHLRHTAFEIRQEIIKRLSSYPVAKFMVCHCTGLDAYSEMKALMGDRVSYASTGTRIHLAF
ncbi:MBL fold metallo-hydrolase [Thermospira aquatica]|uniref:MBL fold metallo-hydrolase n=1 Tax=Thermospira aquatica TaxID=2828656 RepID=A0AAX3BAB2_9SPIR|nr:MBL fold metallo-hydrolase [Thermospira aquatica]URA09154.1 MBL fold metallo-hydrolase [Thermospira aquatica]